MELCANTHYLNQYMDELDREDAYETAVETKLNSIIDSLTDEDLEDYEGMDRGDLEVIFLSQAKEEIEEDIESANEPDE